MKFHWSDIGHIGWLVLWIFPRHAGELVHEVKEALKFWKGCKQEASEMNLSEIVKLAREIPELTPQVEKLFSDIEVVIGDIEALKTKIMGVAS
jgi:acetolactate synthase regulatory subunit